MNVPPMEGILFANHRVAIDPRSIEVGGSWQGPPVDGCPSAWNRSTIEFVYERLRTLERPRFLDIGANTGSYCLLPKLLPKLAGFAFEPNPAVFPILQSNLQLNGLASRVTAIQAALANQVGHATLKTPAQSGLASLGNPRRFDQWTEAIVPIIRLDDFAAEHLTGGVDLIKIDTEGCELHVLMGGQELLKRCTPDVLCEYYADNTRQFGYEPEMILQFMESLGYVGSRLSDEDVYFRHRSKN